MVVSGERFLLLQALINLCQNAVEFSPENETVTVALHSEDRAVTIEVLDRGPGIPAYAKDKIYDRFYSLPRTEGGRKSTGLGLSFVREIMTQHGGEVGLASRPDGGTRAWLRLSVG